MTLADATAIFVMVFVIVDFTLLITESLMAWAPAINLSLVFLILD